MKTTYRPFKCPYCAEVFHHNTTVSAEPETCPLCEGTGKVIVRAPVLLPKGFKGPRIAKKVGKQTDDYLKAMEEGAKFRADIAVESHGMDRAEAMEMEMGNAGDNLHVGDIAVRPVNNVVSQHMAAMPTPQQMFAAAPGMRRGAATGPSPYAGMGAMNAIKQSHGAAGGVVTDAPAAEVGKR